MADVVLADLDLQVRALVYDRFMSTGRAPLAGEIAGALGATNDEVGESLAKLAAVRHLVLQPGGEVLMANPFSAVPTAYVVQTVDRIYWGNCIWDALGIPNMLGVDATISTACPDCGEALHLSVEGGRLAPAEGVVHFAVPARKWWEDIVYA
jgi:alkylmercury lyase-like protein